MREQFQRIMKVAAMGAMLVAVAGCAQGSRPAGRTPAEKAKLLKPGNFGTPSAPASADRLRGRFDFYNEEIIREDVAVSTVFMGDSITELWDLDAYFLASGGVLQNRGIGGDISTHMARRFEADVLQLRPRNVVILAGTNDVARMLKKSGEAEIIDTVTNAVGEMMEASRKAGIRVYVGSILPTNSDTPDHAGKARILVVSGSGDEPEAGARGREQS